MSEESRVATVAIIVEDQNAAEAVNRVLHEFGTVIVGRMGLPYREKNVSVINVVLDAPMDTINSLTGKLGMVKGISAKTLLSKV